jgi:hypothetical protein
MAADGREGRLDHRVAHDPDGACVLAAAEPAAQGAELGLDLVAELLGPAAQRDWPAAVDEVLPSVEQEERASWGCSRTRCAM